VGMVDDVNDDVTACGHRRRHRADPAPAGHAAPPGTGPVGETCGSCGYAHRAEGGRGYLKCGLMGEHWTTKRITDVRARDSACSRWKDDGR
jgi:hypothetical protein